MNKLELKRSLIEIKFPLIKFSWNKTNTDFSIDEARKCGIETFFLYFDFVNLTL